jgi:hypothetical protein
VKRDIRDATFSTLIRMRAKWTCEWCGKYYEDGNRQGLHCSHLLTRRSRATRWHSSNACAHCFSCHQKFGGHPLDAAQFIEDRLGKDGAEEIRYLHSLPIKLSKTDLQDVAIDLKAQLKAMEEGGEVETPAVVLLAIEKAQALRVRVAGQVC